MAGVDELAARLAALTIQMNDYASQASAAMTEKTTELDAKWQQANSELRAVVESLRTTFTNIETALGSVQMQLASHDVEIGRLKVNTAMSGGTGSDQKVKPLIPSKNMLPEKFSGRIEDWRHWKSDV